MICAVFDVMSIAAFPRSVCNTIDETTAVALPSPAKMNEIAVPSARSNRAVAVVSSCVDVMPA